MASACVNNLPDPFLPWLPPSSPEPDFEFPLDPPATMLPADQLFSDGKLLPLHLKPPHHHHKSPTTATPTPTTSAPTSATPDPYLFSPKAPRCSSRWRDLLGLKKLYPTAAPKTTHPNKSLKNHHHHHHQHHRTAPKSTSENAPLLLSESSDSLSRLSLSSSSSSHDHDDLPRLSLDSEKQNLSLHRNHNPNPNPNPNPRIRLVKPRAASFDSNKPPSSSDLPSRPGRSPIRRESDAVVSRGVSVDSPRMNSSGKIVFQSLERSSSSPSTFNGGPRFKHRGMERSYSANVRVTPVLNVPVCSLRAASKTGSVFGFGQLFSSPQKRESKAHHNNSARTRN